MNFDLKFVELTADVLEMLFIKYVYARIYVFVFLAEQYDPSHYEKTHPHSILQVPKTQLAKMSTDPKFVELTADVLEIFYLSQTMLNKGGLVLAPICLFESVLLVVDLNDNDGTNNTYTTRNS